MITQLEQKPKSLRDKFAREIKAGQEIEKNPSAYTEESFQVDPSKMIINMIREQKITQDQLIMMRNTGIITQEQFTAGFREFQYLAQENQIQKDPMTESTIYIEKENQVLRELRSLEQYLPQIKEIERVTGVKKDYRHTKDFLNKKNEEYEIEETFGYADEGLIEASLERLDQLLRMKKIDQPIPFIEIEKEKFEEKNYIENRNSGFEEIADVESGEEDISRSEADEKEDQVLFEEEKASLVDSDENQEVDSLEEEDSLQKSSSPLKKPDRSRKEPSGYLERVRKKEKLSKLKENRIRAKLRKENEELDLEELDVGEGKIFVKKGVDLAKYFME